MGHILAIQGSYKNLSIALFNDNTCIEQLENNTSPSSAVLIPMIHDLLKKHNLTLSDIAHVAIDNGPGAFTSLRVVVVTANGLSFGSKHLSLIPVSGLEALHYQALQALSEKHKQTKIIIAALLNAYNNEVYSGTSDIFPTKQAAQPQSDFGNIDTCLDAIAKTHPNQTILFTGNGAQLHRDRIATKFGAHALFETTVTPHSNAMSVGNLAIKMLDQGFKGVKKLSPLYLKPNMGSTSGS